MEPQSRPRKRSRFFSGGRSVLDLLSDSSHHRQDQDGSNQSSQAQSQSPSLLHTSSDASSETQSLPFDSSMPSMTTTPATSFESTTSAVNEDTKVDKGKGVDLSNSDAEYTSNHVPSASASTEPQPQAAPRVAVATSALENLSVSNKRRYGLGPDDFEQLRRQKNSGLPPLDWQSHLAPPQRARSAARTEDNGSHGRLPQQATVFPGREGHKPRTPLGGWHNSDVKADRGSKHWLKAETDGDEGVDEEENEEGQEHDDSDDPAVGKPEQGEMYNPQRRPFPTRGEQLSRERPMPSGPFDSLPSQQTFGQPQSSQGQDLARPGIPAYGFGRVGLGAAQLPPFQHTQRQPSAPNQHTSQPPADFLGLHSSQQHQVFQGHHNLSPDVQAQLQAGIQYFVHRPRHNEDQPIGNIIPALPPPTPTTSHDPARRQTLVFDTDSQRLNLASTRNPDLTATLNPVLRPAQAINPTPNQVQNMNVNHAGITNLPFHATRTPNRRPRPLPFLRKPTVSPNLYTSPDRIPNALAAASRKRKRPGIILPPQPFIYIRTNDPAFNIFDGILLYPELCFHLAGQLRVNDLVSLYAISRDFHTIIDTRFTTAILSQSLTKCPESSRIFPFRCYAHLCRLDPAARIPHPDPRKATAGQVRAVPSFRWLKMVLHREKVVHEIMAIMAEDGVPLPSRCALALKRMWFLLDIPDNARRIGYIHAKTLFTDLDLYFSMAVFVKLDMRLNDPCGPEVRHNLRKLILAQRSLTFLLRVLNRTELTSTYDVMRAWIRWRHEPLANEYHCTTIFGVPIGDVGRRQWEYWGQRTAAQLGREVQFLLRPEQLVMREAVRRGIRFHKHFMRSFLYGYIRPDTLEDYQPREEGLGGRRRIKGLEGEYEVDDEVGGVRCLPEGYGVDPVLDLGERKEVSVWCVKPQVQMDTDDLEKWEREERFLERCMEWCEDERQWEDAGGPMDLD